MELKLKKAGHDYYEGVAWPPFSCETMRECIVPDSCADIARIVDTAGLVCLTGRELTGDGRFCASGTVEVSVLYIPEKGDGPCALRFQLPFQCCGEGADAADTEFLDIRGELQSIDTRALNPRKVLTRANLVLYPSGCRHVSLSVCTGAAEEDGAIQLLREKRETWVVAGVREKEFTFVEELPLSPGREAAAEILSTRLSLRGTDSKLIGSKLVVKGLISASVLYRESGGGLSVLQQELPFSQILEGSGFSEDLDAAASYRLLSADCRVGAEGSPDDPHVLTLSLLLRARVTARRREEIAFIADLYSTAAEITCQTTELSLREDCQRRSARVNVRELLETGAAVKAVVDTEVGCGTVRQSGGAGSLEIPLWARCLYLYENDALRCVRRDFSAACQEELPEGCRVEAEASCRGDVMASILPDGIELRFPVDCELETARAGRYLCVAGGESEETESRESGPSLTLRKMSPEESLWSVAKQYRTTCRAILEVNDVAEEGQLPTDRLLLIPRAR